MIRRQNPTNSLHQALLCHFLEAADSSAAELEDSSVPKQEDSSAAARVDFFKKPSQGARMVRIRNISLHRPSADNYQGLGANLNKVVTQLGATLGDIVTTKPAEPGNNHSECSLQTLIQRILTDISNYRGQLQCEQDRKGSRGDDGGFVSV
jgi:hypothetical protein